MKKRILFIMTMACLILSGCAKDGIMRSGKDTQTFDFSLDATLDDFVPSEEDTKASATTVVRLSWSKGDQISVINLTTGKALGGSLIANESGTTTTFSGTLTGAVGSGDKLVFLYPSQGYTEEQDYQPVTIDLSHQVGSSKGGVPICVYATTSASWAYFNRASAKFSFLMSYIQFSFADLAPNELINSVSVDGIGSSMSLSLTTDGISATPSIGTITMNPSSYYTSSTGTKAFYMSFAESPQMDSRKITVSTESGDKEVFFTGASLDVNKSYTTIVTGFVDAQLDDEHEYVDLGLPSGTKWATMNIGATSPEEYGDYFAWGETEPCFFADHSAYKFWTGDASMGYYDGIITKYNSSDNKIILDKEDDAAYVNWGGSWRMPTDPEMTELRENCTWIWNQMNGVSGYTVTGPNGNSIFLPAGSYKVGGDVIGGGIMVTYWSSTLDRSDSNAWGINGIGVVGSMGQSNILRYYAVPIRPVKSSKPSSGISGLYLNTSFLWMETGTQVNLTANVIKQGGAVNDQIEWTSSDPSVAAVSRNTYSSSTSNTEVRVEAYTPGIATLTAKTVFGGFIATCEVTVYDNVVSTGYEYVDLGLPSGLKWATMNVGATSPDGYGDYFAWGETEPSEYYWWDIYKWTMPGESDWPYIYKYTVADGQTVGIWYDSEGNFIGDNKTVLDLEDDVAHAKWGDNWRMPTAEEQDELREECTWVWEEVNGVNGYTITGPNGNSIFLPAAGTRGNDYLDGVGSSGNYWSSSLGTNGNECASQLWFSHDSRGRWDPYRFNGYSVRPVYDDID